MMHLSSNHACRSTALPGARFSALASVCTLPPSLSVRNASSCPPSLQLLSQPFLFEPRSILGRKSIQAHASRPLVFAEANSLAEEEEVKRSQVAKRLETVGRYFKQLGTLSFWGQLVCTVVSAVILAFSVVISGKPTAEVTFYLTAGGIAAAFLSVFWAFGYIRLSQRLRKTVHELSKAPPRVEVVNRLKNGVIINLIGMGLTLLGMEATVGALVAKSLTSTAGPAWQGVPAGYSPVLALDVFLVQASANTVVSHFLGLVSSLELLRAVNKSPVLKPT